jgi:hypothetical protein
MPPARVSDARRLAATAGGYDTMSIASSDEASAILRHYIRALAERSGLRWTPANDADFDRIAALLDQDDAGDTIPPYRPIDPPQLATRVTQVLSQEEQQLRDFEIWRQQRAEDEKIEAARRIMRR